MELKALLIGINAYPTNPLNQCVSDMRKMSAYLKGLESPTVNVSIKTLADTEATRANVLAAIKDHLGQASDTDVALLYFSGHGAQEESAGLFPDVHDGLLECLVCYDEHDTMDSRQLLASKEIRYALAQLPHNPHLVTIVDACHSGDIVRAFHADTHSDSKRIKRLSGSFPERPFKDFLFAKDDKVVTGVGDEKKVVIPAKNHIHIAACQSTESSWEDAKGGVFTRYLLHLLKATSDHLSYLDITRWAKISLQEVTSEKQTPTIYTIGNGKVSATDSWLNLHPNELSLPSGQVINTVSDGWVFTRGSLLGVQTGMEVTIELGNGTEKVVKVDAVGLEQSTLDMSVAMVNQLDQLDKPYFNARTELTTFNELRVSINSIDHEPATANYIVANLQSNTSVKIVDTAAADFQINIFNGFVYFSLPEHDFQPLARQIEIDNEAEMQEELLRQLDYFVKWHHFQTLDNPGKDYEQSPIRMEVEMADGRWMDITNGTFEMQPEVGNVDGEEQYQTARIRVKNVSKEKLYVGILTLNSNLSITSNPFEGLSVTLMPGEKKLLYDHLGSEDSFVCSTMDLYKQIYNWKEEWFYYKIIFNNYDDFGTSLQNPLFLQPPLEKPLYFEDDRRHFAVKPKGEGSGKPAPKKKKWGTCLSKITLPNLYLNVITGNLEDLWEQYETSEDLAPFIKELYFEEVFDGTSYTLGLKQNKNQTALQATKASSSWVIKAMNWLYKSSRIRKFRRQRHQNGPIVVAEGDSWFLFPKPGVRDTLDYIMDHYRLLGLAEAGDEIADYIKFPELLTSVIEEDPDFVLISGGGNDILGEQVQELLKAGVLNGAKVSDYLKDDIFSQKLELLRKGYISFFEKIHVLKPNTKIFIHGYDYIRSNPDAKTIKSGWANRYMIAAGIDDPSHRDMIIRHLVDTFNEMLQDFAAKYPFVRYVNHRGTVQVNEWMDEIHPNNTGYQKVAANFLKAMQAG